MSEARTTSDTAFLDDGLYERWGLHPGDVHVPVARDEGTFEPTPEASIASPIAFGRRSSAGDAPYRPRTRRRGDTRVHPRGRPPILVLPTFYPRVAAYTCTYLQWYPDGGVGVDVVG